MSRLAYGINGDPLEVATCPECEGHGEVWVSHDDTMPCPACDGTCAVLRDPATGEVRSSWPASPALLPMLPAPSAEQVCGTEAPLPW